MVVATPLTAQKTSKETLKPIKVVEQNNPTMDLEIIGPKLAQKYLDLATPNRKLRPGSVAQYARDMIADRWHSSVIRFDTEGCLRDGQHRLNSVIMSKTEQLFWVERNVPVDAFRAIDSGIKRTMSDHLAIAGEHNTNVLATGIRYAAWMENFPGTSIGSQSSVPMSPDEVFEYLENNPDIRQSVPVGVKANTALRYPPSLSTAIHYLAVKNGYKDKADSFWEQMISGADLIEHTGPWALRKIVIEDHLKTKGNRLDRNLLFALSIKAWNYYQYNILVRRLQWLRNIGESFPTIGKKPNLTRDGKLGE